MAGTQVAVVQLNSGADTGANLREAGRWLRQAAEAGARLAVLPENFSFMGRRDGERRGVAEPDGRGPVQDFLAATAAKLELWIVGGTVPLLTDDPAGRIAPACVVYDAEGRRVARYDKIHLFDVVLPGGQESYRESAHFAPGREPVVIDTPAGRLGLSICYDIRFPELYRRLVEAGAELFAVPAAFTVPTGRLHWETLMRARAIENLCYVLASAQCGTHPSGRETFGDSMIVDDWGTVLARRPQEPGVVLAAVDLAAQAERRRHFPALDHRVPI
ncbi:MAG TPA: carbon-nitrogen hydrolase family protein [Steroidobacteraceae bacterium]|nr:carbon-nitrogen hydrolase family protein [Steroidobacteraceae bacterium]